MNNDGKIDWTCVVCLASKDVRTLTKKTMVNKSTAAIRTAKRNNQPVWKARMSTLW